MLSRVHGGNSDVYMMSLDGVAQYYCKRADRLVCWSRHIKGSSGDRSAAYGTFIRKSMALFRTYRRPGIVAASLPDDGDGRYYLGRLVLCYLAQMRALVMCIS